MHRHALRWQRGGERMPGIAATNDRHGKTQAHAASLAMHPIQLRFTKRPQCPKGPRPAHMDHGRGQQERGDASRREAHGAVAPEPTGHAPIHPVPGKPRHSRIPVRRVSLRRVPILPWHRVTHKWAGRGRAGRDGGASSIATGDWAARRTRTAAAVALGGTLSFVNRYSMLSRGMVPLFAGLGLYCHAPGGVAAPPGVTSLSPSREGDNDVCRRARQEEQGRLRARWCLRDTRASPEGHCS